jgi:Protein of unknown function (DUF4197)
MFAIVGTFLLVMSLLSMPVAHAQLQIPKVPDILKERGGQSAGGLSESRVADGLKEALRIGTDHAVLRTGKQDGYFGNPLIKILLPDSIQTAEKGLRLAGFGPQVDELVLSMNRAAEKAAPKAKEIFVGAITSMTIDDATKILNGGDTSATDFFKRKTSTSLYKEFRPIVDNTMQQVGTVQKYNEVLGGGNKLPLVKAEKLDVGHYVTDKALDGLFLIVAEEERDIRKNPAARVTDLLKDVFGR